MKDAMIRQSNLPTWTGGSDQPIHFLMPSQVQELEDAWSSWAEERENKKNYRFYIAFRILRITGCRLGELVLVNDVSDIDHKNNKIRMPTLKQYRKTPRGSSNTREKKKMDQRKKTRILDLNGEIISLLLNYKNQFPSMHGQVFGFHASGYRKVHLEIARGLGFPEELQRAHILRHTRIMEMVMAGVPMPLIQSIAGHRFLNSTMAYTQVSPEFASDLLKEKGLL